MSSGGEFHPGSLIIMVVFLPLPMELDVDRARSWIGRGATLLDVRDSGEREALRIPNSVWIPVTELARRWRELPVQVPVVVYCSAGSRSFRASKYLREHGRDAAALVGGLSVWAASGEAVELGPERGAELR